MLWGNNVECRDWRKSNRFLSEIRRLSKVEYEIEEANIRIESL